MTITMNRDSVCAGDVTFDHRQTFELPENATAKELLRQLERSRYSRRLPETTWSGC